MADTYIKKFLYDAGIQLSFPTYLSVTMLSG